MRQRQETRARLFEAAMIEFRRAGVAGAQVEDIVRRAGVARGTFYLHFPTKDHVLLDLARTHQALLARGMAEVMDETPDRFLARLVECLCEVVEKEGCALSREVFAAALRHGGLLRSEGIALLEVTTRYFSQAQARGEVRPDRSAEDLAAMALTGVLAPLLVYDAASPDGLRATLELSVDAFVNGIRA
jgi:AcrR family transcriptional regulator